jgi:hypothetical protein
LRKELADGKSPRNDKSHRVGGFFDLALLALICFYFQCSELGGMNRQNFAGAFPEWEWCGTGLRLLRL